MPLFFGQEQTTVEKEVNKFLRKTFENIMEKKVLGKYVSPKLVIQKIELEHGILASSACFTPGNGTEGNYTPEIDPWTDTRNNQEIDL